MLNTDSLSKFQTDNTPKTLKMTGQGLVDRRKSQNPVPSSSIIVLAWIYSQEYQLLF